MGSVCVRKEDLRQKNKKQTMCYLTESDANGAALHRQLDSRHEFPSFGDVTAIEQMMFDAHRQHFETTGVRSSATLLYPRIAA